MTNEEVGSEERVIQTSGLNTNYQKGKEIDLNRMWSRDTTPSAERREENKEQNKMVGRSGM